MDPVATGTVRGNPREGSTILTPYGIETITSIDLMRDQATTDRGNQYNDGEIRFPEAPEDRSAAAMEAWLDGPDFILVMGFNVACSCSCTQCDYLVVIRGDRKTATHQRANDTCTCGPNSECCGYPLGS